MFQISTWLRLAFGAFALTCSGCTTLSGATNTVIAGDSLVLAGTAPGNLCLADVVRDTVTVRNTYEPDQPHTVLYEEGVDYTIDYGKGAIARTPDSRIPDFSTNMLYGQKDFDHNQFTGFGNAAHFVFADYVSRTGFSFAQPVAQPALLPKTLAKLQAGGPFKLLAYGDSITAGGDASARHLQFQEHYARHLAALFPKAMIEVENGATGGDSTVQGLARLEEKVLTRSPDLVLVGFGMNDHNINSVPVDQFEENLVTIVTRIRETTGAEAILYSAFPPNDDWKYGSHRMEAYAAATQRAAERLQCAFADVYGLWMRVLERKDPPSLLGNNINHPNDFGHWLYFQALTSVPLDMPR
ncbi:MAG: SGNH/GDSL hydrolase family protein [Candidatus Hydrogenedentes bacterium]|nr:SGNH/GDSL hydrolase family protein [Candidatus Hydrogenedentota bacterium]